MSEEKCERDGCENEACELHTCPFKSDINNDDETLCNCCDSCKRSCWEDR